MCEEGKIQQNAGKCEIDRNCKGSRGYRTPTSARFARSNSGRLAVFQRCAQRYRPTACFLCRSNSRLTNNHAPRAIGDRFSGRPNERPMTCSSRGPSTRLEVEMNSPPKLDQPPQLGVWLLSLFAVPGKRDLIMGDLSEEYLQLASQSGRPAARRWYWRQVLKSLPASLYPGVS